MPKELTIIFGVLFCLSNCGGKVESTFPERSDITESVYSSGIVKSKDQYVVFTKVSGIVKEIFFEVGDTVRKGDPIIIIENDKQQVNVQNALLSSNFYNSDNNIEQLDILKNSIQIALAKKEFDSLQFFRQKKLMDEGVGVEVDLDLSKLNYENSILNYNNAVNQYEEFKRQLNFNSSQARNNLRLSTITEKDYIISSEIDGFVYSLETSIGELVNPQRPLGVIGSTNQYILEMLVDESDVLEIQLGQTVLVKLDSYEEEVHEAIVTRIYPLMDRESKSFKIEARFIDPPLVLYPNMNFEANIVIKTKENALLIPREYVLNKNKVILENGDTVQIETGLKDYRKIEVLSGISENDKIIYPEE